MLRTGVRIMRDILVGLIEFSLNRHIGKSCLLAENIADDILAEGFTLYREGEKKKYDICNMGCDDETQGTFEFTEEQYRFLDEVFTELNKNSTYGCMPQIFIGPKGTR
jgi:hypothetical protein